MIDIIFRYATEHILVKIDGNSILFGNTLYGAKLATIDGLRLNHDGVIKEFPDLKDNPSWREEAIYRFKLKIKEMRTEEEIVNYIIEDLKKYGYIPLFKQRAGFRKVKL